MVDRYRTTSAHAGERLDLFLAAPDRGLSRTRARKLIDLGGVHVDGRRVRQAGMLLKAGQRLEVHRDSGPLDPYRIAGGQVLFQDRYLVVLDKPAGIETQPTPARYKGTLYEALQVWLGRSRRFGRKLEIGMAQRLDRDTSGVIAFSIHPRAHKSLTLQMQTRAARKTYLALVEGRPEPPSGRYQSMLARDRRSGRMRSASGGRESVTVYRVRGAAGTVVAASLVEIDLVTGRTHQIRAHFSEAGHPLLGDARYGGRQELDGRSFARHCLHSWRLELRHPVSGEPLTLEAEPPADMAWAMAPGGTDPAWPAPSAFNS